MNLLFVILTLTGLSCVFVYGLFLIERTLSFSRYKPIIHSISDNSPFVTVLIAARNEERNIPRLLQSLKIQSYPSSRFEVIVINDLSQDGTVEMAKASAVGIENFTILTPDFRPETGHKKHALAFGISNAKGNLILTTDADCIVGKEWIKTMVSYFDENTAMVSGPVRMITSDNFFSLYQALEFSGLVGIGAGSVALNNPNICNGANLAYRKNVFSEVNGFEDNLHLASGDDEFLMHKIHALEKYQIVFAKNIEAVIDTLPCLGFIELLMQRIRWGSKSRHYRNKKITLIMMTAFFSNFITILMLILGLYFRILLIPSLILIAVKAVCEIAMLYKINSFQRTPYRVFAYLPSIPFQFVFMLFAGIASQFYTYSWKGRKVK